MKRAKIVLMAASGHGDNTTAKLLGIESTGSVALAAPVYGATVGGN
jgi:hypothetical protein